MADTPPPHPFAQKMQPAIAPLEPERPSSDGAETPATVNDPATEAPSSPFQQKSVPATKVSRVQTQLTAIPKPVWYVLAAILAVGALTLGLFFIFSLNQGTILVKTSVASELSANLNGSAVKTQVNGKDLVIRTYTGRYRLSITRKGYEPFVQDITVGGRQTIIVRPIFSLLPPNSDGTPIISVDFVRGNEDNSKLFFVGDRSSALYDLTLADRVPRKISTEPLPGIYDIEWSKDPNVAIILASTGTYLQEIPKYDFSTQLTAKVSGTEVESASWDPTNAERLAVSFNGTNGDHSLIFTDRRLSYQDRKADLTGIQNPKITWTPDSRMIILRSRAQDKNKDNIWVYTTADGSMKSLTTDGGWGGALPSPDSKNIIAEQDGRLYAVSLADGSRTDLRIVGSTNLIAWRDAATFFVPDVSRNRLLVVDLQGNRSELAFSFSNPREVNGLLYFPGDKTVVFYTDRAIYTLAVGL
jgi:hypothetical protein